MEPAPKTSKLTDQRKPKRVASGQTDRGPSDRGLAYRRLVDRGPRVRGLNVVPMRQCPKRARV